MIDISTGEFFSLLPYSREEFGSISTNTYIEENNRLYHYKPELIIYIERLYQRAAGMELHDSRNILPPRYNAE